MTTLGGSSSLRPAGAADGAALRRDAARDLLVGAVLLLALGGLVAAVAGFGAAYVPKAALLYTLGAVLAWRALPAAHPHPRFGPANRVTLARLATGALLGALIGEPVDPALPIAWAVVVIATLAAVADAADGPLARRSGLASPFGARFDMETDAAFTLVLCGLVLHFDQAGPWVLAAGLMRYAFVAAARVWPWLSAPLPPSLRRKTVCVVQITALIVCLGPIIPRSVSAAIAAASLLALTASFALDVRWLARARAHPHPTPEMPT